MDGRCVGASSWNRAGNAGGAASTGCPLDEYLSSYAVVGLLLAVGIGFVMVSYAANRLLRPHRPTRGKLLGYECPVGGGWAQSQVRYYVFAFRYLVFAVDPMFLFPWAIVFARPGFGAVTLVSSPQASPTRGARGC